MGGDQATRTIQQHRFECYCGRVNVLSPLCNGREGVVVRRRTGW